MTAMYDPKRPVEVWDAVTRALHWISALFVLGMLVDGYWMNHFVPRDGKLAQFHWHVFFGVYFTLLVLIRLVWRLRGETPTDPAGTRLEHIVAKSTQGLIYLAMIIIPAAGWISWSARERRLPVNLLGWQVPYVVGAPNRALEHLSEDVHIYMAYGLLVLALLHAAGALRHHFVNKNDVLTRMLSGRPRSASA